MSASEPAPARLLVVRHGMQEQAEVDGALTAAGRRQAAALAPAIGLEDADRLVSSTLQRAVVTATALGRPPEQFPDLDEFRFGPSRVRAPGDETAHLALWRPGDRAPGGESVGEFHARVAACLSRLLDEPPRGRVVLVAHAGVIDAILRWVFGLGPESPWTTQVLAPHASVTELHHWPAGRHAQGAPRHTLVVRLGDVRHLPPELMSGT